MTTQIGRKTVVGIGKETTVGTKATTIHWFKFDEFDPAPMKETIGDESAFGRIEARSDSCIAKKWSEPSIGGILYDKLSGYLMLAAFGANTTSGDTPIAGVYSHAMSVKNDNVPVTCTIVWKDEDETKMITGAVLSSLEINQETGERGMFKASFTGGFPADTTDTPAVTDENAFCSKFAEMKLATALSGLSAASAIAVESFRVTIEKNVDTIYPFGSDEPSVIFNKQLAINGEFALTYAGEAPHYNAFAGGTKQAMQIFFENTDVTIGATAHPSILMRMAKCDFETWARNGAKDDRVTQTVGFVAEYSTTDSKIADATLVNLHAAY